jgi:hypothetical protein
MVRTEKSSVGASSFVPSAEHQISLGEAHQLASTITVYGKLIADVPITPSEAGTVHPRGEDESLQLALVFGISDNGQCITLPQPQKSLPSCPGRSGRRMWLGPESLRRLEEPPPRLEYPPRADPSQAARHGLETDDEHRPKPGGSLK